MWPMASASFGSRPRTSLFRRRSANTKRTGSSWKTSTRMKKLILRLILQLVLLKNKFRVKAPLSSTSGMAIRRREAALQDVNDWRKAAETSLAVAETEVFAFASRQDAAALKNVTDEMEQTQIPALIAACEGRSLTATGDDK
ncbi:unnamed protein product, partial [Amoebophrya sp. A120]|eukprot:GSA120T00009522001.1